MCFRASPKKTQEDDYDKIAKHAGVTNVDGVLTFRQAVAVVRHGERLDSTPAWSSYPERTQWPMDPPLTTEGHFGSREVGHHLQDDLPEGAAPFEVIVSSPYLRCVESACQIARILKIPVVFDRDVGEIFGEGFRDVQSNPHRSPKELAEILRRDFPDVKYSVDADGVQMVGSEPPFPETLKQARRRFQFKAQLIIGAAATQVKSVVIVTHADALHSVASLMKMSWNLVDIPFSACFIAARSVGVMRESTHRRLKEKTVYGERAPKWGLTLDAHVRCEVDSRLVEKRRRDLSMLLVKTKLKKRLYRNEFQNDPDTSDDHARHTLNGTICALFPFHTHGHHVLFEDEFEDCSLARKRWKKLRSDVWQVHEHEHLSSAGNFQSHCGAVADGSVDSSDRAFSL
jgi:broad specificity phosphatase PhoE